MIEMKKITLILVLLLSALSASAESKDNTKSSPGALETIDEKATDAKTCAKKMERFYKSQDCLATQKNKDVNMKPDAIKNCADIKDIKYPSECQYSS